MPPVLETKGLVKQFGGIVATDDVTLSIQKGARHALIGRARLHRWVLFVPNLVIRQFAGGKAAVAIPESDAS